jgi:2-polyprenyl-3-methyl-5-hydroxy-6-metoxy-1,4-benzoquinol methylase
MKIEHRNPQDHNRQGYDAWAKTYESDPNSTVFADDEAFPPLYGPVRGQKVLEIGAGTGRHTVRLVERGNDVTALDLSAGMLAVAKAKPELSGVHFVEGDALAYHPEETFDAVVGALVLEHVANLGAFFQKVHAWLAPGGRAYFSEIHPSRMEAGSGARFERDGVEIRLASVAHRSEDFRSAAEAAGLKIEEQHETLASPALLAARPEWGKYRGKPMLQIWILSKLKASSP